MINGLCSRLIRYYCKFVFYFTNFLFWNLTDIW